MSMYDYPIRPGNNVPDPCKFLTTLYQIWFRDHGIDVVCKVEEIKNEQEAMQTKPGEEIIAIIGKRRTPQSSES